MKVLILALLLVATNSFAQAGNNSDPEVVEQVDTQRYTGLWYEIGHFPNFFQKGCLRSTAEYQLLPSGELSVENTCYRAGNLYNKINGRAYVPNRAEPAKLKVDFGFPGHGDYWIVDLDPNYEWVVVSGPKKESLFILSRTAPMNFALFQSISDRLTARGFDMTKLILDEY